MAATVDYLFGYDATAGVVDDWMYEQLAASYVFDAQTSAFLRKSNPWALRGIAERLLEAADRGLWAEPRPAPWSSCGPCTWNWKASWKGTTNEHAPASPGH